MPDSGYYFVEAIPLSPSTFAIKSYNTFNKGYELAKRTVSPPYINFNFDLLQKQIDGVFCVDGKIHYSKDLNKIVYLYTYRNEYIVADTNLNLLYRSHTIDTFSRARIKVANVNSDGTSMLGAPPLLVNGKSCVAGNKLYIQSPLLSRNENIADFESSSVIDVYNLDDGYYSYSFYIPMFKNDKFKDFQVNGNLIVTIFNDHLVLYEMNQPVN